MNNNEQNNLNNGLGPIVPGVTPGPNPTEGTPSAEPVADGAISLGGVVPDQSASPMAESPAVPAVEPAIDASQAPAMGAPEMSPSQVADASIAPIVEPMASASQIPEATPTPVAPETPNVIPGVTLNASPSVTPNPSLGTMDVSMPAVTLETTPVPENMAAPADSGVAPAENPPLEGMTPASPNPELVVEGLPGLDAIAPAPAEPAPEPPKKKSKLPIIIIAIVAVILIGIGGFAAYLFIGIKPQKVYSSVINEVFESANTYITKYASQNTKADAKSMKQEGTVSFESNLENFSMLNNYVLNYTIGADYSNESASFKLDLLEKKNSIFNLLGYLTDNNIYIESSDLYEGVIDAGDYDVSELLSSYEMPTEDITYLMNAVKNALINSLDSSKYDRKLETVTINGKSSKVFNNSYKIDEATSLAMTKSMLTSLKNDSKALEIISKIMNISLDELTSEFDNTIKELTDPKLSGESTVVTFNIYTSFLSNKVEAVKIYDGSTLVMDYYKDGTKSNITVNFGEETNLVITIDGKITEIRFLANHETIVSATIVEESENKANSTIDLTYFAQLLGLSADSLIVNIANEETDTEANTTIKINLTIEGEVYDLTIKNKIKVSYDATIDTIDTDGAVPYEELDSDMLMNNFLTSISDSELGAIMEEIISGNETNPENPELPNEPEPETPNNPEPETPTKPTEPEPETPPKEYDANCKNASCASCSGDECTCTYFDSSFNEHTITCPNPNN